MSNYWSTNSPARFWLCRDEIPDDDWQMAIRRALPVLGLTPEPFDVEDLLVLVLGEGQFGPQHWQLSPARRMYYMLKPLLPSQLRHFLRRLQTPSAQTQFPLGWPTEERYARFQWEVVRQLLLATNRPSLTFRSFWPDGQRYAFVITHDIETEEGQAYARAVADLDESHGFRSSFNFVPDSYPLDRRLIEELRMRGFEIGVHGLRHDGKLFHSRAGFLRRAERINQHLRELDAVGFRSPLMMRQPEWMQALQVEYDLSFFDTDPHEPIPGGTMSIWPFTIGHFVELPYTLVQDSTLTIVLGETTPRVWLQKVEFIARYHGMVLLNAHPDYLSQPAIQSVYVDFLQAMKDRGGHWHALPKDVARWWRVRLHDMDGAAALGLTWGRLELNDGNLSVWLDGTSTDGESAAA